MFMLQLFQLLHYIILHTPGTVKHWLLNMAVLLTQAHIWAKGASYEYSWFWDMVL